MQKEIAIQKGLKLVEQSTIAILSTISGDGYPISRAMIKMEHTGLTDIWFSTNTSSQKIVQITTNPKATVYFIDMDIWMGLLLVGEIHVLHDRASRERLWREGFERYYPKGIDDPDYSVLHFSASQGILYHALDGCQFDVE